MWYKLNARGIRNMFLNQALSLIYDRKQNTDTGRNGNNYITLCI